jgi:long-chain acyl-CoA synthetase
MADKSRPWPAMTLAEANAVLTRPGSFFEIGEAQIGGANMRVWKRAPATLNDLFLRARGFGTREFLVFGEERVSFEDFARAALKVCAELKSRGVRPGDRVALAMRNLPEWPAVFFGAALAGAIAVPLNAWWTASELEFSLNDCGAKAAFLDAERWALLEGRISRCPALESVFVCRCEGAMASSAAVKIESLLGAPQAWRNLPPGDMPEDLPSPDADAAIFYTSGTMAVPRGAICSHRNILSSIMAAGFALARDIVRAGGPVPGGDYLNLPQRGVLLAIPLFHVTGACAVLVPALFVGARLVLMHKWDSENACRIVMRERIRQIWGVPAIARQLLAEDRRKEFDLSSLRLISFGGAPFDAELAGDIRRAFPHAHAGCGWGMTETAAICTSHSGEDYLRHPSSCGLPAPVCDLKVTNLEATAELPPGEAGELWARGPNVARGYWNRPLETQAVFVGGWVRTGDLARLDAEGFCTIVDRAKDMLIRGGENIFCSEVEHALCAHPAVCEAAVVPIPHRTLGEEPGAIVRLKEGCNASEAELRAFVGNRLAAFKAPVKIVFWTRPLPRNAGGKLTRRELRNAFPQPREI